MQDKPRILLVDDEERILRSLGMLLRMQYQVFATSDGNEALAILQREKIHVVISDQRMPIMPGTELLRQARTVAPDTIRILLTGYADVDAALDSVNEGEIFRYINKPWGPKELRDTIAQAVDVAVKLENIPVAPAAKAAAVAAPATGVAAAAAPADDGRLTCLVLDHDETTYRAVQEILGPSHEVVWRKSVQGALQVLAHQRVAILITELSLGNEDLSAMVKTLKQEHPDLLTIILTCFKDTARLVELINQAQVFRYLPKPLRKGLLTKSIESTVARYHSLRAQPVRLATQVVEKIQDQREQGESAKIADYLAKLRAKSLFPPKAPA